MKYVFLDVDGVLNNIYTESRTPCGYLGISRKLVKNLASVIRATDAIIILISDWKIGWESFDFCCSDDAKYLNAELAKERLRILGKTYDNHVYDQYFEDRGKGIKSFLINQKNVESFVVIDDHIFSDFDEDILNRLVKTDTNKGFTEEDAGRAIEILSQPCVEKKGNANGHI